MTNNFLTEYYIACNSGEIIVGNELMASLEMYMSDMTDKRYLYNTQEAHKRIKFIERECKHSKSPFAGEPFILELWQKAYLECKYSFYMEIEDQWLRRFVETLLLVARKNGKSPLSAAETLAEFFCGNIGTSCFCASNDDVQAGIVFDEVNNMRESSPKLRKVSRKNNSGIFMGNLHKKNGKGKWSYQNKAEIKKMSAKTSSKEGRNIDFATVDESHEMKDDTLVLPIQQAQSTKDEPMYTEITTEGFIEGGHLDQTLIDARKVLKGEIERPRWLIWLYTQDSEAEIWQDKTSWYKSNPNMGVSKKWHYLEGMVEKSKTSSGTRAFVLAKDFNIKQNNGVAWLTEAEIINTETFDIKDFTGAKYISGADFMETTDLCNCKLLLKKPKDPMVYLYSHYWIPESKLELSPDDVDYREWERDGYLTIVPGNSVDSSIVADWQYDLYKEYALMPYKCGYDNRYAKDYIRRIEEVFGRDITENVPQDTKALNIPMRQLEADLRSKQVNYNNCYGDYWCFRNTGLKVDSLGRQQPAKLETKKRIDGTSAAVVAYAVYDWYKNEFINLIQM